MTAAAPQPHPTRRISYAAPVEAAINALVDAGEPWPGMAGLARQLALTPVQVHYVVRRMTSDGLLRLETCAGAQPHQQRIVMADGRATAWARISRKSRTGRCRTCANRHKAALPGHGAAVSAGLRRRWSTDPAYAAAGRERARAAAAARDKAKMADRARALRLWERGNRARWAGAPPGSEARAQAGARISATKLRHIPRELRDDYRRLIACGHSAADATQIITDHAEAERRRFVRSIEGQDHG